MEDSVNKDITSISTSCEEMDTMAIPNLPREMLEQIFQSLRLRDLLRCREVCQQWKSAATIPARKKSSILSFSERHLFKNCSDVLILFIDCLSVDPQNFPVSEFCITLNTLDAGTGSEICVEKFHNFFQLISPIVTELTFDIRLKDFKGPTKELPSFPKLKIMNLEILSDDIDTKLVVRKMEQIAVMPGCVDDDEKELFSFPKNIMENAPNLESITLKIGPAVEHRGTIMRSIDEMGIRPKLKLLTSLRIHCAFDKVDWGILTTIGLKLKSFAIELGRSVVNSKILKRFLESQATTLNSLEIGYKGRRIRSETVVRLPCLPHVTKLTISETYHHVRTRPIGKLRFPGFSFHTQLPSLKELDVEKASLSVGDLFVTRGAKPLVSLEKFVISDGEISPIEITQLFPNIKSLHLEHVESDEMTDIFENMKGLEELSFATDDSCLDVFITGLLSVGFEVKSPPSRSWLKAIAELELPTTKTMACLENLKVLRIVRSEEDWTVRGSPELTEISGIVLKKMKSLKYVDFGVRKYQPVISQDLKEDLEKHGIQILFQSPLHKRTKLELLPNEVPPYRFRYRTMNPPPIIELPLL